MTLAQQFPDVSMLIREKHKLNLKHDVNLLFKDMRYAAVSADQKFYDNEFRIFHYKLISFIVVLLASLFLIILNGQGIWKWIIS
jgi:hypothetical protein